MSLISPHFSLREFTRSSAATRIGDVNMPQAEHLNSLKALCNNILEPLRAAVQRPVRITSGFRSAAVNKAIRGSITSQHMKGEAVDLKVKGFTAPELLEIMVNLGLPFDQVIQYDPERGGHVHVSYTTRRANRGQKLHAVKGGGYRTVK